MWQEEAVDANEMCRFRVLTDLLDWDDPLGARQLSTKAPHPVVFNVKYNLQTI